MDIIMDIINVQYKWEVPNSRKYKINLHQRLIPSCTLKEGFVSAFPTLCSDFGDALHILWQRSPSVTAPKAKGKAARVRNSRQRFWQLRQEMARD